MTITTDSPTFDVLVTGARDWADYTMLSAALWDQYQFAYALGMRLKVIHGNCPDGADAMADHWAKEMSPYGVIVKPVDADWERPCDDTCYHKPRYRRDGTRYCPLAGHIRNQQMVDMRPRVCLAFLTPASRGTRDCARRAEKASVPLIRYPEGTR